MNVVARDSFFALSLSRSLARSVVLVYRLDDQIIKVSLVRPVLSFSSSSHHITFAGWREFGRTWKARRSFATIDLRRDAKQEKAIQLINENASLVLSLSGTCRREKRMTTISYQHQCSRERLLFLDAWEVSVFRLSINVISALPSFILVIWEVFAEEGICRRSTAGRISVCVAEPNDVTAFSRC